MPQAAPVLNVVSPPKHSVSLFLPSRLPWQRRSWVPTTRVWRCLRNVLRALGLPGSALLPGVSGDSWPPLQTQQSLWIQLPDVKLKKGYNARDLIFLFVFTAAKSLLNKKSDGGVKVGVSTPLA